MARGEQEYITQSGRLTASPIWLAQFIDIQERDDAETTHDYYFTDAPETISFFDDDGNAEAYLPIGMEIDPIPVDTSQKMVSFRIRMDNVSRSFFTLAGTVKLTSGRCILSRAFLEDLSDPNCAQVVFRGSVRSWVIGESYIELEIGSDIPLINKAPRRMFGTRCQWRFKDDSCGYSGATETCDKTIETCTTLSNEDRFGGFPHIPQSRDPREVWTKV